MLMKLLLETYPATHKVVIYQTTFSPLLEPIIETAPLADLSRARVTVQSLLYVPPLYAAPVNEEMKKRLGYA